MKDSRKLLKAKDVGRKSLSRPVKRKHEAPSSTVADSKRQKNSDHRPQAKSCLLEEIEALQGDTTDLQLIGDVSSDDELEPNSLEQPINPALRRDLAALAGSLGLSSLTPPADEDSPPPSQPSSPSPPPSRLAVSPPPPRRSSPARPATDTARGSTNSMAIEARPDWFNAPEAADDSLPDSSGGNDNVLGHEVASLKAYAKTVWERDAAKYATSRAAFSSQKFLSTIMSSGTMSDKVSALALAVQDSPLHNARALENLMSMAGKKSRGQALVALGALVDLFGPGLLLPPNRRLRQFQTQPSLLGALQSHRLDTWKAGRPLPGNLTDGHLVCWIFEDWIKDIYFSTIRLLESWLDDEVHHSRTKALDFVFTLLKEKPEQESNLLRLVVHKLGDHQRKIASRASYLLCQLLTIHPAMKPVVIRSVEQEILLRPSQTMRARYYAITALNQTVLSYKEPDTASLLQRVYFSVFVSILKTPGTFSSTAKSPKPAGKSTKASRRSQEQAQGGDQESEESINKLIAALLTGVNRAVPFSDADDTTIESHLETLFRITHSSNFSTSVQALMLIFQISTSKGFAADRFYRTLYESLLDPRLATSSNQTLYLNLLYRSLKSDSSIRRVKAFVKRMMQIASLHQPPFVCGIIFLIAELHKSVPDLAVLLEEPEAKAEDATSTTPRSSYDGRKRDPEFSNAYESCLWEIGPFIRHFHPSVQLFARGVVGRNTKMKKPELSSHTLIHFLDKFVFKNPKASEASRGGSIMQPVASNTSSTSQLLASQKVGTHHTTVNTPAFWKLRSSNVAVDDLFFHDYFSYAGKRQKSSTTKKTPQEDGDEPGFQGPEDEDGDDVWNALVSSRPEVEGDEAESFDGELNCDDLDFDMSDMSSDVEEDDDKMEDIDDHDDNSLDSGSDEDKEEVTIPDRTKPEIGGIEAAKVAMTSKVSKSRRKAMRSLPMFASADEFEELLANEEGLTG